MAGRIAKLFFVGVISLSLLYPLISVGEENVFLGSWPETGPGSGDGQLRTPKGIAIGPSGNVYVVDTGNFRIQKFDSTGKFLKKWGTEGAGAGQFDHPIDIAVDTSENVYVLDNGNESVQKFNSNGNLLKRWTAPNFIYSGGISADTLGNVYVSDFLWRSCILKYDSNGRFLDEWNHWNPLDVENDQSGNVYVLTTMYGIYKHDSSGKTIWNNREVDGTGIAVDLLGNVYSVDTSSTKIHKYGPDGELLTTVDTTDFGDGKLIAPFDLKVDNSGNLYVIDRDAHKVKIYGREAGSPPVVTDIPDQIIYKGGAFSEIRLDDYVSDPDNDDADIAWTCTGNVELSVNISDDRVATITLSDPEWVGSEAITLTATDPDGLNDSDSAVFTVEYILPGDVNGDGQVRANDAILALRITAGLLEPTEYQIRAADMNGDGQVKSDDAILILREATGLAAPQIPIARSGSVPSQVNVSLDQVHGIAGETTTSSLKIGDIHALAGGEILISYDPEVLRAIDVSCDSDSFIISNLHKPGKVVIAFANMDNLDSKTLAHIKLYVLTDGVSPLNLESAELYNSDAIPVKSKLLHGRFSSWNMPPEHTMVLQNFPNPFNPDTWIPYQLRVGSMVTIRIYSSAGRLVREFDLGYRSAGIYANQDRAAYWDGKNESGEDVASGIYFYNITAGDFSATRKMTVRK